MADDPLSSKEAMGAFIQRAHAAGKTDDEIRTFVQAKRQTAAHEPSPDADESFPPELTGAKKVTYPFPQANPAELDPLARAGFHRTGPGKMAYGDTAGGIGSIESAGQVYGHIGKIAAQVGLPIAGMELGGGLVPKALIKARPLLGMAGKVIGRAAGGAVASEATAPLEGEAPSLQRGLKTARNIALAEGVVRAPAYVLGRAGGVEPMAAAAAQDRPELLKRVPASEYATAAKDVAETHVPPTAEHAAYMNLVKQRGNIDGMAYVNKILGKVRTGVDEPTARLIERKTASLADQLFWRLGPKGNISAEALDDWIRVNVSEPAARVYEKGAGTAWQERLASLRDDLTPKLYEDVGGGAAELQRTASIKIGKKKAAETMFPAQTEAKPNIRTPTYLRQVLRDSDLGEQVRVRLRGLDEVAGTNHLERIEDLAMRSSWTAAEKGEVEDILANLPTIRYERVGLVRAGARKMGRGLTRVVRPVGRIAAVGSTIRGVSQ